MNGAQGLVAAFVAGLLTSASPCVLAAVPVAIGYVGGQTKSPGRAWALALAFVGGMNLTLLVMGLAVARLGGLLGALPGPWVMAVGVLVLALAIWMWFAPGAHCGVSLPQGLERRLASSGLWGAAVLGALIGTVMSPCASPALAAALAMAGSGSAWGDSAGWGAMLLLAYGLGHSALLLVAGATPALAESLMRRAAPLQSWLPGRRVFAIVLAAAGLWWTINGMRSPV